MKSNPSLHADRSSFMCEQTAGEDGRELRKKLVSRPWFDTILFANWITFMLSLHTFDIYIVIVTENSLWKTTKMHINISAKASQPAANEHTHNKAEMIGLLFPQLFKDITSGSGNQNINQIKWQRLWTQQVRFRHLAREHFSRAFGCCGSGTCDPPVSGRSHTEQLHVCWFSS